MSTPDYAEVVVVELTIPGTPRPKKRARAKKGQRAYTPRDTQLAERALGLELKIAGARPVRGPVVVQLGFYLPDRRRVDIDNLEKLVLDACNGIAYVDDSQIVEKHTKLVRGSPDPRTELSIRARLMPGETLTWEEA